MANPDKPVFIPDRPKDKDVNKCAEFNHNIMGRYVLNLWRNQTSDLDLDLPTPACCRS